MSPTLDLSIVGYSNHLDGDPDRLDSGASTFIKNADAISNAGRNLKKLTQEGNEIESDAFGALSDKAREIESNMSKAAMRYRLMGQAVKNFSGVLREEQNKARQVLEHARQAQQNLAHAEADYRTAQNWTRSVDENVRQQGMDLGAAAVTKYRAAEASLSGNKGLIERSIRRVEEENSRASNSVQNAMEISGLDDSLLDKIKDVGKKVLDVAAKVGKWIWDNLETIALVVKVISLVAPFIPVVGPAIAAAAAGLLTVLTVAIKIKTALRTIQTVVSVGQDIASGNYSGAAKTVLTYGANYAAKKLIGKASKSVGNAVGKGVAQHMYSISPDGVLQSTEGGRQIHEVVMKYGPKMINDGDPLPDNFVSIHINRTTDAIEKGVGYVAEKSVKGGINHYYKPIQERAIDGISGLLKPLDSTRAYEYVGSSRPDGSLPGGGGGGGW